MKEHGNERVAKVIGIDLAERSLHVCGVDERGQKVISKSFARTRLRAFMANLPACWVALEACGSATVGSGRFAPTGMRCG